MAKTKYIDNSVVITFESCSTANILSNITRSFSSSRVTIDYLIFNAWAVLMHGESESTCIIRGVGSDGRLNVT